MTGNSKIHKIALKRFHRIAGAVKGKKLHLFKVHKVSEFPKEKRKWKLQTLVIGLTFMNCKTFKCINMALTAQ